MEVYKTEEPGWYTYLVITEFYTISFNYIDFCTKLKLIPSYNFNYQFQIQSMIPIDLYENRYKKMWPL